jgi:phospholipase D1/2
VHRYFLRQPLLSADEIETLIARIILDRNWDTLNKRDVTEQIYVHSKLLIADDRVAILGSANINDRSQLGDRDSELTVIARDDLNVKVKLNREENYLVSQSIHNLRIRLWRKLFGLTDSAKLPATKLAKILENPAAKQKIKSIQDVAESNLMGCGKAFPFLSDAGGAPTSIWPTWNQKEKKLDWHMPFNDRFWRSDEVRDELFTWSATQRGAEQAPTGIQGFLVAFPLTWTEGENNISGMNLTLIANNDKSKISKREFVAPAEILMV